MVLLVACASAYMNGFYVLVFLSDVRFFGERLDGNFITSNPPYLSATIAVGEMGVCLSHVVFISFLWRLFIK